MKDFYNEKQEQDDSDALMNDYNGDTIELDVSEIINYQNGDKSE